MTWTKTGDEFPAQCANAALSDAAYRTHHEAIAWVSQVEEMSLRIPKRLVRRFAGSDDYEDACLELVIVGFWKDHGAEYEIVHHADTIRASIGFQQGQREAAKGRMRRLRNRDKPDAIVRDVTPNVPPNVTPNATYLPNYLTALRGEAPTDLGDAS